MSFMKLCIEMGVFHYIFKYFRRCVTLDNRVHDISIENDLKARLII
jgi:hypothetical protein